MHHAPAGSPLTARLRGTMARRLLLPRRALNRPRGRLALAVVVSAVVTLVVLGVPVLSVVSEPSTRAPSVSFGTSAASSASGTAGGDSPVVMGRDGQPLPSSSSAGPAADGAAAGSAATDSVTADSVTDSVRDSATSRSPEGQEGDSAGARSPAADATADRVTSSASSGTASAPTETSTAAGTTAPRSTTQAPAPTVPDAPQPAVPAAPGAEEQVLGLVNAARARAGCAALVPDVALGALARAHSVDMREAGVVSLGPLLDLGGRAATLAHGADDSVAVVQGWLSHEPDRSVILDCSLGSVGIGVATGPADSWWTQLLG